MEKNNNSHTARMGDEFSKEIEEIKDVRLKKGIDKKRKSTRKLTNLIPKHKHWPKIKADMQEVDLEK